MKHMKKITRTAALLLLLALTLTSCHHHTGNTDDTDAASSPAASESTYSSQTLQFSTTDINDHSVTLEDYSDAKVIMVNLWEPWCGPCVGEMPELQKLYTNYKDKGLVILGVYGTEEDAQAVVKETGVTYPILHRTEDFTPFETDYVPTTFFVDGEGHLLSAQPVIGSQSYAEWEATVLNYLK